jgi:hypothetical protein
MSNEVDMYDDVKKKVAALLEKPHPQLWVEIKENEVLLRVQPTRYDDNPVFYNPDSDSRYADGSGNTAVLYLASSAELAIAETIQQGSSGPGTPVMRSEVEERSLHYLKVARPLRMVDAGMVISCLGKRPGDVTQPKGQGSEGYSLPQAISAACCEHDGEPIDGLVYRSGVYDPAGTPHAGRNLVLFEGRGLQVIPLNSIPLAQLVLSGDKTVFEFLEDRQLDVE